MLTIDELKEKIYFPKTREYFKEVEKSFYNENYRSAIVMLYSVVIADLLYKLEELRDYYSDSSAKDILATIDKKRKANPKSSEWETNLIELVFDKTEILEPYVYTNLEYLKSMRNFSAHPSLNHNNDLISPSREKTLGMIKDMLSGIFIRPPLFIKRITDNILEDIADKKADFLTDDSKFEKYIDKKYIEKVPENMIIGIFKDFWKITFKLDNEECNENREINLKFLLLIMKKYKMKILEDMQKDIIKYNNISENADILVSLAEFLYYEPDVYDIFKPENKISLEAALNKRKEYKAISFYMKRDLEEHINSLTKENLTNKNLNYLLERKVEKEGKTDILLDKYIECFSTSMSFNGADKNFDIYINQNIKNLTQSQISNLLEKINSNNQIYNRGRARFDNNKIISDSEKVDWSQINMKLYPNFEYDEEVLDIRLLPF